MKTAGPAFERGQATDDAKERPTAERTANVNPSKAIITCFRNYAVFSGRAPRAEYWWFFAFIIVAVLITGRVDAMAFSGASVPPLTTLVQLVTLLPLLAVSYRRMHDIDKPGWLIFLPMIVSVAFIFLSTIGYASGPNPNFNAPLSGNRFAVLGTLQAVAALVILWWLTRAGDPKSNTYGPPPAA